VSNESTEKSGTMNFDRPNSCQSPYDGLSDFKKSSYQQRAYMKVCRTLAAKSPLTHKHGCIVVKDRKIISTGFNDVTFEKSGNSVHAEVSALRKVKHLVDHTCTMYVVRNGPLSHKYSKPCATCADMIRKYKIRTVFYSVNADR
jgi:pyrimidine deaminase RibD-like protein